MNQPASALTGLGGERVALCDVAVSAVLQDLLAEVTVSQTYRNDEPVNIEAVYTFALPLDAVLLDLQVHIGGRALKGVVVEKNAAEQRYEDAVEAGDAAVMLEAIEPGLYTMNVGNLKARENAKITFRYAILYRWTGDRLRFFLPTTIAPCHGQWQHQPHQRPEASLTVENQFSLRIEVLGALRNAQFSCPSHAVAMAALPDKTVLSLRQAKAVMDRDFVLTVKAPQATRSFALCGQDGTGTTAIASFQPFFPGLQQPRALALAIVIDCSGSMGGVSMEQAKQALDGILDQLQPEDRVTLIAFGNNTRALSNHLLPCSKANVAAAREFAMAPDADMGGTDIGNALCKTYAALGHAEAGNIFLVTDGEVHAWQTVVEQASKSGHRIFTVGVGSAVSEGFVRGLAAATDGECELVSPREGMAERVVRHFERMRAPRARRVAVHWPHDAVHISPARIGAVFEGDTLIACATFDQPTASGSVVLEIETDRGEIFRQALSLPSPAHSDSQDGLSTVARVAAAARLTDANEATGLQTALRYCLISPWTHWLVIAPREEHEKTRDIPALRKVPQTLAAGWGGTGSAVISRLFDAAPPPRAHLDFSAAPRDVADRGPAERVAMSRDMRPKPPHPYRRLLDLVRADASRLDMARALNLLAQAGLAAEFDDLLQRAAALGLDADLVAAIIVTHLLSGPLDMFVSADAQEALVSLQQRTREAMDALCGPAPHGAPVGQHPPQPIAPDGQPRPSPDHRSRRAAPIHEFLQQLDDALQALGNY